MYLSRSVNNKKRLLKKLLSRYSLGLVILLALLTFLFWAWVTPIDIFVQGTGRVTSDSNNKIIEHLEGGILTELHVAEGQKVEKGMLLFVVENPKLKEMTEILGRELSEKQARVSRLTAEKNGTVFTPDIIETDEPVLKNHLYNEWRLYQSRQQTLNEQKAIISQKIEQKKNHYDEINQATADLGKELEIAQEQRDMLESLITDRAGSKANLLQKRMDAIKIESRINQAGHKLASIESELKELALQKNQLDTDFREEVQNEFNREIAKITLLEAQIKASEQRQDRSEIRSPVSGTLHQLVTATLGEVVSPGTVMAEIVPENEPLLIEANIQPQDRARIWLGQKANIRVSAYDYSSHGGLVGIIKEISADTYQKENAQEEFYQVSITTDEHGFGIDKPLRQGMTVDVYIVSGKQTVLTYLLPDAFTNQTLALKWPASEKNDLH